MKALSKPLAFSALLACLFVLAACGGPADEDSVVYVFVDLTEIEENEGSYDYLDSSVGPLMERLGQDSESGGSRAGASVYIFPIYDFPLNRPMTARLERGSRNQNPLDRRDAVRKFEQELRSGMQAVVEDNLKQRPAAETYRQSHIYGPVCEGIKGILRQGEATDERRVVIFSDMLENSPAGSFYQGELDPKDLDARCVLPDLSGLCMNIVYQPMKQKSELVLEGKAFWTRFFESKGLSTMSPSCFSYESYL